MEWQPIETAPKDRDVWLFGLAEIWHGSTPFECQAQGGWDPEEWRWMTTTFDDRGQILWIAPTHWMPLPAPPEEK